MMGMEMSIRIKRSRHSTVFTNPNHESTILDLNSPSTSNPDLTSTYLNSTQNITKALNDHKPHQLITIDEKRDQEKEAGVSDSFGISSSFVNRVKVKETKISLDSDSDSDDGAFESDSEEFEVDYEAMRRDSKGWLGKN